MPATAAAPAMLHIIGIVLMTKIGGHYQGIAPRIANAPAAMKQNAPHAATHSINSISGIEKHTAFLAFLQEDVRNNKGVKLLSFPSPTLKKLRYVPLDGVQITFESELTSRAQKSTPDLQLAHLQTWCPAAKTLRPEFQGPDFTAAAAVADFSRVGPLTACTATAPDVSSTRLDTQVMIENKGELTITIKKGRDTRRIRLKGDAHFYFANLPASFLDPNATALSDSPPHFEAYFQMVEPMNTANGCTWEPAAGTGATSAADVYIPQCLQQEAFRYAAGALTPTMLADAAILNETARFDAECANSQWP